MSVRFAVRLTPRAGADRVDGVGPEGQLLVRVRAAPAEGAANRALLRVLADEWALRRRRLRSWPGPPPGASWWT
ncbi:MAG: DUF167 domain-containing protein [Candidatus Limnocylindrales bacterium]